MNRETIEKAAKEAVRNHFQCNGEYPCEELDYCEFCDGRNSAFDCKEDCTADSFSEGFFSGADWRINSVWHDENEKPDKNRLTLFECKKTYGKGYSVNFGENYPLLKNVLLRWAYVADLLPEGMRER